MIDRDWLDAKLRAVVYIFGRSVPERIWESVLDTWTNVLDDCDQTDVERVIDHCVANNDHRSISPAYVVARIKGKTVSIAEVIDVSAEISGISSQHIIGRRRKQIYTRPRHAAMKIAIALTNASLPIIGRAFGGRDHTTVIHARRRAAELCESDPEFAGMVRAIERRLIA